MALDLVTRIYCDPGDVVLAEGPSYVGALGSFAAYQARVVHVAMDAHGLVPSLLRDALRTVTPRPKFLYTVPTFHNPAGVTLSRRAAGRGARDLPGVRRRRRRGQPVRAPRLQRAHLPGVALARPRRRLPGLVLQDVRGRACGWAGRSCRPRCATGWCSPPNRRPFARRVSPRCWSRATWRVTTGAARSRPTPRPTATGATPCSARWRPTSPTVARGTSPTAGSTCGSRCRRASTRRRCSRAR